MDQKQQMSQLYKRKKAFPDLCPKTGMLDTVNYELVPGTEDYVIREQAHIQPALYDVFLGNYAVDKNYLHDLCKN